MNPELEKILNNDRTTFDRLRNLEFNDLETVAYRTVLNSNLPMDIGSRALRFFEEVCELMQSLDMDSELLIKQLNNTYSRLKDDDYSGETGDCMLTLMILKRKLNCSGLDTAKEKVARLIDKISEIEERNKSKLQAT